MLLYAQTDDEIQPNNTYTMSGNKISVRTLDLNCEFAEIAAQLNKIVDDHFEFILTLYKEAYSFYKQYAFFFVLSCNSYELDL